MLVSLHNLLQQQTDSVRVRILDLNAPDSAGFQWFPPERKKDPKVLFSITYRIQWNSAAQYLERETRLASGVRPFEIQEVSFLAEAGKDSILDLFLGCFKSEKWVIQSVQ